jgi:hypothetical protein
MVTVSMVMLLKEIVIFQIMFCETKDRGPERPRPLPPVEVPNDNTKFEIHETK